MTESTTPSTGRSGFARTRFRLTLAVAVAALSISVTGSAAGHIGPVGAPAPRLSSAAVAHTAIGAAAASAMAPALDAAGKAELRRGAAAVQPEARGTVVAHGIAAEVTAYRRPDRRAAVISTFANPTERGGPLVFQGLGRPIHGWLQVLLPIRPNGTTGWIHLDEVETTVNPYRIEVDASAHRLTIYRYGRERLSTVVSIGTGDTPTPIGDFFLVELLRPSDPEGLYGPFAYGLSGYSDTLDGFNGGRGVIGIHGTNQPEYLGDDVSHGCIRVANRTITEMSAFLPLGTPVAIFTSVDQATTVVADGIE